MEDILLLADKVKNTLTLGESHYREFKSALEGRPDSKKPRSVKAICEDISEALVSFANADQIQFERQEIKSREYDRQFVDGAIVPDLDLKLLQGIADQYIKGLSIERYLQQIGLAEYGQNSLILRRAALLLFASDIDRWHPRSQIRFLKVSGNTLEAGEKYNVISDDIIKGNIFELVIKSWEHLRSYLAYKTEFGANAQFQQKYIYPEDAVREAILNAIAHRDYSITNAIEIYIFDDRMEIKSPGPLISTITVKNLYELEGAHESRNALIASVLRENNLMRELGEGMKRIFSLMQNQEMEKPELYSNGQWFSVTLSNKTVFSHKELEFLQIFTKYDLNTNQKQIILLGIDAKEFSTNDIFKALNISNTETEKLTQEITTLRKHGIVENFLTSNQIQKIAFKSKQKRKDVPRYRVKIPV